MQRCRQFSIEQKLAFPFLVALARKILNVTSGELKFNVGFVAFKIENSAAISMQCWCRHQALRGELADERTSSLGGFSIGLCGAKSVPISV
ncbi:hypothetical protein DY467_01215 [Rhodopseudomonas sp. BR0G17]|nr:hypothetical protein [Rhodopseudomonas sp. BR0G17]